MSPLQISIMLHYYSIAEDWRDGDHSAPAVKDTLAWFLDEGLLRHANFHVERFENGKLKSRYECTDRGRAYVEALQVVPLPVQTWVTPAQPERQLNAA